MGESDNKWVGEESYKASGSDIYFSVAVPNTVHKPLCLAWRTNRDIDFCRTQDGSATPALLALNSRFKMNRFICIKNRFTGTATVIEYILLLKMYYVLQCENSMAMRYFQPINQYLVNSSH